MKIKYSRETDCLVVRLSEAKVYESDEFKPGIILDFDEQGNIVRIEILDASSRTDIPSKFEYEVVS